MSEEFYKRNLAVPFFTQRDNTYIWQQRREDGSVWKDKNGKEGPKYPMAWRTCNITSLCMVLHYFNITTDTPNQMIKKVFEETDWGWLKEATVETGTRAGAARLENWSDLKKVAELYIEDKPEYTVEQGNSSITIDKLHDEISKGLPVIISTGLGSCIQGYDTDGHIVVVRGFTKDGDVILNDPFGIPVDNDNKIQPISNTERVTGYYYSSPAVSIGDNVVIKLSEFKKIFLDGSNTKYLLIRGPLWGQPGGSETDLENSYPIKSSNLWHNGIHLESESGFYSIGSGRLIAARNSEVEKHGSNSFALIKYQIENKEDAYFYALYMHLKKIDLKKELYDFFMRNNCTVSNSIKNTWYEQIFNNLLPAYGISYYKEKELKEGDRENIYEAEIINNKLVVKKDKKNEPIKAKLDSSNSTGIESRQMKCYLLPPDKIDFIANIENYSSIKNLDFMYKKFNDNSDLKKDGYYFFICGNSTNRKLCCSKSMNFATNWMLYNTANYKYYVEKLYDLYMGKIITFPSIPQNKTINEIKNEINLEFSEDTVINNSIFNRQVIITGAGKFGIRFQSNGQDYNTVEYSYVYLLSEITNIKERIEEIFVLHAETGITTAETELIKNYKNKRIQQINKCLLKIESAIDKQNVDINESDFISDKQWMIDLFKDAEIKLDCKTKIHKAGIYDIQNTHKEIRSTFFALLDETSKQDLLSCIAICEFLVLEFISIPKNIISASDRFYVTKHGSYGCSTTIGELIEHLKQYLDNLNDFYKMFFKKRYIDTYIEIPKGAKIGEGSNIPDSNKKNSIHFEVFSVDQLLDEDENKVTKIEEDDKDEDNFYNVPEITKTLFESLSLSDEEKNIYCKYYEDNIITKDEIKKIYKESNLFKHVVIRHQSEWVHKKYKESDLLFISAAKKKVKEEVIETIDYMNEYYDKYNWLNKDLKKEIGGDKFFFYHPLFFIEEISKKK